MKTYYCDVFVLPLPPGHRFPMAKYELLRQQLAASPLLELLIPPAATDDELERVHAPGYVRSVRMGTLSNEQIRRIGFPWSSGLFERSRRSVGGTLSAARSALEEGLSVNLAGGTHHAFSDRGEGFCVFNDVAVAVRGLQAEGLLTRAGVVDLDVHQGNGTHAVFQGDPTVFTLSVHGARNFPFTKVPGSLDLELPDGTGDRDFLDAVEAGVRAVLASEPELVFFLAGADPFEDDRLGRLAVTKAGLAERDRLVLARFREAAVPVAVVMGGGYARNIQDTVEIHATTVLGAARRWAAERVGSGAS